MNALIIEDELDNQEVLRLLLSQYHPDIALKAQCYTAQAGLVAISEHQPQLVFLDIGLPDMTGFDMLSQLDNIDFGVVFVSAHEQHAAQAFRWSALDFLVKPVTPTLLSEAIAKAKRAMADSNTSKQLSLLLDHVKSLQKSKPLSRLALPTANDIEFVDIETVIRIEGEKNYSTFYLGDKRKITVSRTLGEYEKILAGTTFMRIQKSHIVNLVHVRKFVKSDGGWITTTDGAELPVSPLKRDELLEQLAFVGK